jgi:hypothetical protein
MQRNCIGHDTASDWQVFFELEGASADAASSSPKSAHFASNSGSLNRSVQLA